MVDDRVEQCDELYSKSFDIFSMMVRAQATSQYRDNRESAVITLILELTKKDRKSHSMIEKLLYSVRSHDYASWMVRAERR
jgi:hypothetical protein